MLRLRRGWQPPTTRDAFCIYQSLEEILSNDKKML